MVLQITIGTTLDSGSAVDAGNWAYPGYFEKEPRIFEKTQLLGKMGHFNQAQVTFHTSKNPRPTSQLQAPLHSRGMKAATTP